jgi:hypothetical protein
MQRRIGLERAVVAGLVAVVVGACSDGEELVLRDTELYAVSLTPLNGSGVTGAAAFEVTEGGDFVVGMEVLSLADGQPHPQHVRAGPACPTSASDADGDGLIDVSEAATDFGLILIPLDEDLADPGVNGFPTGTPVEYQASVAYGVLMAHLDAADIDPDDSLVTLDGEDLQLDARTVVIHGAWVREGGVVAGGTEGATYDAMLPVACGTIDRVGPGT